MRSKENKEPVKIYEPDQSYPLNLDMSAYERPNADKSILFFAWIYAVAGIVCIFLLIFRNQVPFLVAYHMLLEAMTAILLLLSGKCCFSYIKLENRFLRWDYAAVRILSIKEYADGYSEIAFSFKPSAGEEFKSVEEFRFPVLDKLKDKGLNALPIIYHPAGYEDGRYYIDLRFNDGIFDDSRLCTTVTSQKRNPRNN